MKSSLDRTQNISMFTNFKKKRGIVHLAMRPVIEVRFWKNLDKKGFQNFESTNDLREKNERSETFLFFIHPLL